MRERIEELLHAREGDDHLGAAGDRRQARTKTISALQRYVGVAQTGRLDKTTVKAVQVTFGREAYGTNNRLKVDGIMGPRTVKAIQAAIRCNLDSGRLDSRTVLALQTMLNQSGTR